MDPLYYRHLCGSRVDDLLRDGDTSFLSSLNGSFRRCQINATAVNGVNTTNLGDCVPTLLQVIEKFPDIEFIIQKNEETAPLWEGLLSKQNMPSNVTFLLDESKGTGVFGGGWAYNVEGYSQAKLGFAGGIGISNISEVLKELVANSNNMFWIDMESSLRSKKDDYDVFDLNKCYECIQAVIEMDLYRHPDFLCN